MWAKKLAGFLGTNNFDTLPPLHGIGRAGYKTSLGLMRPPCSIPIYEADVFLIGTNTRIAIR
jgi:hypothetical protein